MAESFLSKAWTFIKGLPRIAWEALVVVLSILIAVLSNRERKEAEGKLDGANAAKTDAVLAQKQEDIKTQEQQVVQQGEAQKQAVPTQTPEELAKELNKV